MQYYLYVSDAKVDMLLSQLDQQEKVSIAHELSIELKVLSYTYRRETEREENRFERLHAVIRHIRRTEEIRGVAGSATWVSDTMHLRWGLLDFDQEKAVWFTGRLGPNVIAMGGSIEHLVGQRPRDLPSQQLSASYLPAMLDVIRSFRDEHPVRGPLQSQHTGIREARNIARTMADTWQTADQRCEFLAKRLAPSAEGITLASPLYVALSE